MSTAIRIENLGKKYTITRQRQSGSGYVSLRDVLSDGTKRMVQKILHPRGERGEEGASGTQEFWALKDINLEVEQGDKLAIIGHNGAGKSTLLKVLSRITEPTTGRITLQGRIASLLEVGTGFHPELTGRENIFLNGSILGMSQREIKHKFDEIVDFSGVETFLDTPVKRYSSGMRMRLGFAVAAHLDSEILVIDEVLAVGDAAFQKKCLGKMDDVSRSEGKTILFVSHSMGIIQQLCNKAVVLASGQISYTGAVSDAVNVYLQQKDASYHLHAMEPYISFLGLNGFLSSPEGIRFSVGFKSEIDLDECFLDLAISDMSYNKFYYYIDEKKQLSARSIKAGVFYFDVFIDHLNLNSGFYAAALNFVSKAGVILFRADSIGFPEIFTPHNFIHPSALLACPCNVVCRSGTENVSEKKEI